MNANRWVMLVSAAMLTFAVSSASAFEEAVEVASPNPFLPRKLEQAPKGEAMRHGFHVVRTHWDDYFKVYPGPLEEHTCVTLEQIRAEPKFYLRRDVQFDCYFNSRGSFFRGFVTEFHKDTHVNLNCFNYASEIWLLEQRANIYPFLYIDLLNDKVIRKLDKTAQYTGIHVWGTVLSVSEGYPWILIEDFEPIPETQHSLPVLRELELGFKRLDRKDWLLAESSFRTALKQGMPTVSEYHVYEGLGESLIQQHRIGGAREEIIKGLKIFCGPREQMVDALVQDDRPIKLLTLLARTDMQLGYYEEAQQSLALIVRIKPANVLARADLGLAMAKQGQVRDGLAEVEAAMRLAPGGRLAEGHRNRAQILAAQGDFEAARRDYDEAITLRPQNDQFQIEQGDVLMASNNLKDAQNAYRTATKIAPDRAEAWFKLAVSLKIQGDAAVAAKKNDEAGKAYADALDAIAKATAIDDRYSAAYGLKAEILRSIGKSEDANKVLENASKVSDTGISMQNMLYEQARLQNDFPGMIKATQGALAVKPYRAELHQRLADLYAFGPTVDYAAAEKSYARTVELDSSNGEAWANLAMTRIKIQAWKGANEAAEKAVQFNPSNPLVWTDMWRARQQLGRWDDAAFSAEKAFELSNSAVTRTNLAVALVDRKKEGDAARARELAAAAANDPSADPTVKAAAFSALGAALTQLQLYDEARGAFAAADGALTKDPWHNLWYGRALLKSWDPAGARDHFSKAYEGAVSDTTGSKLMEKIADKAKDGLDDCKDVEKDIRDGKGPGGAPTPAPVIVPEPAPTTQPQGAAPAPTESSPAVAPATPAEKKDEAKPAADPKTGDAKKPVIEVDDKAQPVTTGKETAPKTH